MQRLKIEKRILEEVEGLRKLAAFLPAGKALALTNKCNKILGYAKKAQAMVDAPVGELFPRPVHADYDARSQEDIAAQYNAKKAMFEAMTGGRVISLENSREFRTAEMHTTICNIRQDIRDKDLPWVLCDAWHNPGDGRRPFKRYWLIPKEGDAQ